MSKFVKLMTAVTVNGMLRHPHEGVLHLDDEEAQRLIDAEAAADVSGDFSDAQRKAVPVEALTLSAPAPTASPPASFDPRAENDRVIAEMAAAPAPGGKAAAKRG